MSCVVALMVCRAGEERTKVAAIIKRPRVHVQQYEAKGGEQHKNLHHMGHRKCENAMFSGGTILMYIVGAVKKSRIMTFLNM